MAPGLCPPLGLADIWWHILPSPLYLAKHASCFEQGLERGQPFHTCVYTLRRTLPPVYLYNFMVLCHISLLGSRLPDFSLKHTEPDMSGYFVESYLSADAVPDLCVWLRPRC